MQIFEKLQCFKVNKFCSKWKRNEIKNYYLAEHKNIDYFLPLYGHANLEDVNAVA